MRRQLFIFGIVAVFLAYNDAVIFKLTNFVCHSFNESWIMIYNCRLKVIGRGKIGAYFNSTIRYPANAISLDLQIYKRSNGYKVFYSKSKIDVCRFLKKRYDPVLILIGNLFLDFTNYNHTCPYFGPAIMDGFYLRPQLLTLPIPTGDYMLAMTWYFEKHMQFQTNMSYAFVQNIIDQ